MKSLLERAGIAGLVGVAAMSALMVVERRAEACSLPAPMIELVAPKAEATEVPTNARLWLRGMATEVTLVADGATVEAAETSFASGRVSGTKATPEAPLLANTRYDVIARNPGQEQEVRFSFTTGGGPDLREATPPASLSVFTTQYYQSGYSCDPSAGLAVKLTAIASSGAVAYELARQSASGTWETVSISFSPDQEVLIQALPSPRYRIRPLSLADLGAPEHALPARQATTVDHVVGEPADEVLDDDGDSAGCSSSTSSSSSAPGALGTLLLGALALWRRRRRS